MKNLYESLPMKLFENEENKSLISKFHSRFWKKLERQEKENIIVQLDEKINNILGISNSKVIFDIDTPGANATFVSGIENQIIMSATAFDNGDGLDILSYYLHEKRHHVQAFLNLQENENLIPEYKTLANVSKRNGIHDYDLNIVNYFSSGYGNDALERKLYYIQPIERDAYDASNSLTIKIARELQKSYGPDNAIDSFFDNYFQTSDLKDYAPETHIYLANKLEEKWSENEKRIDNANKVVSNIKENLKNKEILTNETVKTCFNYYVWTKLSLEEKTIALKKFDEIESKKHQFDKSVIEFIDRSIFINGKIELIEEDLKDPIHILNTYYFLKFKNFVDNIIAKEDDLDSMSDEEYELYEENYLYFYVKKDGKFLNFAGSRKKPLLENFMPEKKHMADFIYPKLKKMEKYYAKDVTGKRELAIYPLSDFRRNISVYDIKKRDELSKKLYGKPFEKLYTEILRKLDRNIKDYEKSLTIIDEMIEKGKKRR